MLRTLQGFAEITDRGFTDHEHLDEVELIHMNGRVYDYNLGRFLSVDPFIQSPTNTQSLNPYSYILNNPLAGVDPSGYQSCTKNDDVGCLLSKDDVINTLEDSDGNTIASFVHVGGGKFDVYNGALSQSKVNQVTADLIKSTVSLLASDKLGPNENQHVPLTKEERAFAADGNLKDYWNSRNERVDPWAKAGLALWDPEHKDVTDAHRDMAKVLKGRLLYEGIMSGNISSDSTVKEMQVFMRKVGVAVMEGHAQAVSVDYNDRLGNRWGVLDKFQGAKFHHKVFQSMGLPAAVYGGTPIGVGGYVPFIEIQANVSNWVASLNPDIKAHCGYMCFGQGYISNEDTHHDPMQ